MCLTATLKKDIDCTLGFHHFPNKKSCKVKVSNGMIETMERTKLAWDKTLLLGNEFVCSVLRKAITDYKVLSCRYYNSNV